MSTLTMNYAASGQNFASISFSMQRTKEKRKKADSKRKKKYFSEFLRIKIYIDLVNHKIESMSV